MRIAFHSSGVTFKALMRAFFRIAWLVMRKDLRVESRSREMLYTTLLFAASCVLIFAFAFVRGGRPIEGASAGILWVTIAFSGTLALGRAFERERHCDALRGLMLAPVERSAIFVGKVLSIVLLLAVVELIVVFWITLMFGVPWFEYSLIMTLLLVTGTLGFSAVGTLFAAMLVRTSSRAGLLPVLLYPVTVPVMIAGISGTGALIQVEPNLDMARFWVTVLVFFDVVFITLALWTFEPLMAE